MFIPFIINNLYIFLNLIFGTRFGIRICYSIFVSWIHKI